MSMDTQEFELTNVELFKKASELTSIANQIRIINRLIENVEYSRVSGDTFSFHHQIYSGLLADIVENLSEITESVKSVSNDICPD